MENVEFELKMIREMPTVSTEDTTFEHGGVLDGKKPALLDGLEYITND